MNRLVRHGMEWLGLVVCLGCLTGCVDKRFVITTEPPGATVFDEKNQPMGGTPADRQFVYYGKYRFTIVHDGYETMVVEENVRAPWYEYILIDFASEVLLPIKIRDIRRFHYVLQPAQMVPPEAVLNQAGQLRIKGQSIGEPLPPKFPLPVEGPVPRPVPAGPAPGQPVPVPVPPPAPPPGLPAPPPGSPLVQPVPPQPGTSQVQPVPPAGQAPGLPPPPAGTPPAPTVPMNPQLGTPSPR